MDIGKTVALAINMAVLILSTGVICGAADTMEDPDDAYRIQLACLFVAIVPAMCILLLCVATGRPDVFGVRFC